jgi:tol-pal system protein YbgF
MRLLRLVVPALLLAAVPLQAQDADAGRMDKRVGKLESEMRAVQRKVFPGSDARFFEPEITAPEPVAAAIGTPATAPLTDLTDRVGELERQLRTLTGQVETAEFKLRQLEEAQAKQRADVEFRLNALETGGAKPVPAVAPATETVPEAPPTKPIAKPPAKPASADAAWKAAYTNVSSKDWPETEAAMTAFIADWPKSPRLPQAQYWLGRSHAERSQHAEAARSFLKVYETAPRSPQAPDSLIGLAEAMTGLKKPKDACRVLGELDSVYGAKLTADQKSDAAALKKRAKCAA